MRYGTAATRAWRKSAAIRRVARFCNCAKANLEVRSPPGPAGPVSFGDRISRLLAADGDEQVEAALLGTHLGNIQVKEADRVGLEAGALGLRAVCFRQASNAVALQAAVQRGAGQVRQGRLQGVEAVVEQQERVAPQRDDDRLVLGAQHGGPRRLRPHRRIGGKGPLAPFLHGGRADALAPGQCPHARFTSLDRATHCLCRRGAAVKNLAHSASFQVCGSTVALHPGTEHLALDPLAGQVVVPSRTGSMLFQIVIGPRAPCNCAFASRRSVGKAFHVRHHRWALGSSEGNGRSGSSAAHAASLGSVG